MKSQVLQGGRSQAGPVAFVTYEDYALTVIGHLGDSVRTCRVEPPLKDVSIDDECSWKCAIALALFDRPNVYDQRPGVQFRRETLWFDTSETRSCVAQKVIDGAMRQLVSDREWHSFYGR
jgi:hypothetical protein